MTALLLAIAYIGCGLMYVTPGVLAVPAVPLVKWSRQVVGLGMLVLGIGEASIWWREASAPPLLQLGVAIFGAGMIMTLVAIMRQPCAPKA